jgi:4-hydroxythreonine-4-phosphate dehydrogenase
MAGTIQGMTTAPVNKGELLKAGCRFTGHTELLAQRTGAEEYAMMLTAGDFKVVLVTTHVALKDVPSQIKKDRIQSILKLIHKSMPRFGISRPRIGVAALNPHSGEGGMMGIEESREIQPAIEAAQAEGILARGPFPADTLYTLPGRGEYDVFLAMYHDQGLIPLKSGAFLSSVNITLGLPIIRTSVDHGTAYDIAGRGVADPSSLINAIMLAAKLAAER